MEGDITTTDCLLACVTKVEKVSNSRTVGVHAVRRDYMHICLTTLE